MMVAEMSFVEIVIENLEELRNLNGSLAYALFVRRRVQKEENRSLGQHAGWIGS